MSKRKSNLVRKWVNSCFRYSVLSNCPGYPGMCDICGSMYYDLKLVMPYVKPWCHVQLTMF